MKGDTSMKFLTDVLTVITGAVICWWAMALTGMFVLSVCKYLVWFWFVIN